MNQNKISVSEIISRKLFQNKDCNKIIRLLLVDDTEDYRTLIKILLRIHLTQYNFSIVEASDGFEAQEYSETHYFDLVLTDYEMPLMNGYDLSLKLKENNKDLTIISFSASHNKHLDDYKKGKPYDYVIEKGISNKEIIATINNALLTLA